MCCFAIMPIKVPGQRKEIPNLHGGRSIYVPSFEAWCVMDRQSFEYIGQDGSRSNFRSNIVPWQDKGDALEFAYWLHNQRRPHEPFDEFSLIEPDGAD